MGGVDIADQLRTYYSTQRIALRSWYPLFFWILDTVILNAYLVGRQLHGNDYLEHKEFRANLWDRLFSYSEQVFSNRKLAKFHPSPSQPPLHIFAIESAINTESVLPTKSTSQADSEKAVQVEKTTKIQEHKWKALEKRVYCYHCRAIYSATKKRKFGEEIYINGMQRKRAGQTQWACNVCDVALCTSGTCWADFHYHSSRLSC